ncbi:MAG TPA: hypothetical protein ACYCC8_00115 [Candidatus Azoamicus sp.]
MHLQKINNINNIIIDKIKNRYNI